jgi:hypothetical protein
MRANITTAP